MVIYDEDEARHMIMPPTWKSHPQLEEWTGADFMISPLKLPAHSQTLLAKHLKAGAFLVQRKSGLDLVNSIKETGNLWDMLDRMLRFCAEHHPHARPSQRVVLGIGMFYGAKGDVLKVNSRQAEHCNFWQLQGAIERVFERDCTYVGVSAGPETFYKWVRTKELHALDNVAHPVKYSTVGPKRLTVADDMDDGEPLQKLVVIRDGRTTLVTFPGMGETKVNAVWDYAGHNLARALTLVTDPALVQDKEKPSGIAQGLIQAWRTWLGLADGEFLLLSPALKK